MAWNTEITTIVRHLLDDVSDTPKYSDERLEKAVLVCTQLMLMGDSFRNNYVVDITNGTITPDPTSGNRDDSFLNLVALRTACMIIGSEIKTSSGNAISVKDGPSSIDLKGVSDVLAKLYDHLCKQYEAILLQYRASGTIGAAILGPHTTEFHTNRHGHTGRSGPFDY